MRERKGLVISRSHDFQDEWCHVTMAILILKIHSFKNSHFRVKQCQHYSLGFSGPRFPVTRASKLPWGSDAG